LSLAIVVFLDDRIESDHKRLSCCCQRGARFQRRTWDGVRNVGHQVDPEYEKIRAQQRSLKRSQVENDWVGNGALAMVAESDFMTGQSLNVDGGSHFVG